MPKHDFDELVKLRNEIVQLEDELSRTRDKLCTKRVSDTVRGSNPSFPYSERVFKLEGEIDLEANRAINREIAKQRKILTARKLQCEQQKTRCMAEISAVRDSVTRQVLMLRYVEGLSWQVVATRMGGGNTKDGVKKIAYRYFEKERHRG